jgi:hypothetical protein
MALNFKGVGTIYYGECDLDLSGSFVTTEWIVFFYFPLLPLRSIRLRRAPGEDVNLVIYNEKAYEIVSRVRLNIAQVLRTYAFAIVTPLWVGGIFYFFFDRATNSAFAIFWVLVLFLIMGAPFFLVLWVRRKAAANRGQATKDSP